MEQNEATPVYLQTVTDWLSGYFLKSAAVLLLIKAENRVLLLHLVAGGFNILSFVR